MHRLHSFMQIAALSVLILAPAATTALADDASEPDFARFLEEKAKPIVTIKYVMKNTSSWSSYDYDEDTEATGVLVDPHGLVMCSKVRMGDYAGIWSGAGRSMPTEIKILIGQDTEGLEAKLVARDSELDLIWLQITEELEEELPHLDLQNQTTAEIGDRIYFVNRMTKYFDRVPVIGQDRIGGKTAKPRPLYIPIGSSGSLGLPVYDAQGRFVGVPIVLQPDREERDSGASLSGDWGLILPAKHVAKATERARRVAKEAESDEPDKPAAESDSDKHNQETTDGQ